MNSARRSTALTARAAMRWLHAAAGSLLAHWWAYALVLLLSSVVAAVIVGGLIGLATPARDAQLELLIGNTEAGTAALFTVLVQLGVPGLILIGLTAAAGGGAVVVLASHTLDSGHRRTLVALGRGAQRSPISAMTAAIVGAVVALLAIGVVFVMAIGILGLLCYPLLRRASRSTSTNPLVRCARVVTLPGLILMIVPFGAAVAVGINWILAFPIAVLEQMGPIAAIRRSIVEVRGRRASVVLAVLAAIAASIGAQALCGALVSLISADFAVLAQAAVQLVLAPLSLIVMVAVLRERRQGDAAPQLRPRAKEAAAGVGRAASRLAGTASVVAVAMLATLFVVPTDSAAAAEGDLIPTVLQVSTSPSPSTIGEPVTFTLTVVPNEGASDGISGSAIVWIDGQDPIEMGIGAGSGSRVVEGLPEGTVNFSAQYFGNGEFAESTSSGTHTVSGASVVQPTMATVSAGAEPSRYGTEQLFTAAITAHDGSQLVGNFQPDPGTPAQFTVDGVSSDAQIRGDGTALFPIDQADWLEPGDHTIEFSYPGNLLFAPATASIVHTVVKTQTAVTATVTPLAPRIEQSYTIEVVVAPLETGLPAPSGDVTLAVDGDVANPLTESLVSGIATFTLTAPATAAELDYSASYAGDAYYDGGTTSGTVTVSSRYATATSVSATPLEPTLGSTVRFEAEVQVDAGAGQPNGNVLFRVHRNGVAPDLTFEAQLSGGTAHYDYRIPGVESYVVTAEYGGSLDYDRSTSSPLTLVIGRAVAVVTLTQQSTASERGENVEFTVAVADVPGITPSGSVTLTAPGFSQTANLDASGQVSFRADALPNGTSTITASYAGDQHFTDGSDALQHEVASGLSTLVITASDASPVFGQSLTLTATVSSTSGLGPTPSGSVEFSWPGSSETVALGPDGRARLTLSSLPVGVTSVSARYTATDYYLGASESRDIAVAPAATTTSLSASSPSSVVGEPVTYTATVTATAPGAGVPGGTVTFGVTGVAPVTVPVGPDGTATAIITTAMATAIAQPISASYSGDNNFASSTAQINHAMLKAVATLTLDAPVVSAPLGESIVVTVTVTPLAPSVVAPSGVLRMLRNGSLVKEVTASGTGVTDVSIPIEWLSATEISFELVSTTHTTTRSNGVQITGTAFTPGLSLTSNVSSTVAGDPVILTARLDVPSGFSISGSISFYDGALLLTTRPITLAGVSIPVQLEKHTVSSLTPGDHQLHAVFRSDVARANDASSLDTAVAVGQLASVTEVLSPDRAQIGEPITWLVSVSTPQWVSGATQREPRGRIDLLLDGAVVGSALVSNSNGGRALINITTPALPAGSFAVEARFVPTSAHAASAGTANLVVFSSETRLVVTHGTPAVEWGEIFTLTAAVESITPGNWAAPSGAITVRYEDGSLACTIAAAGGPCSASWSTPGAKQLLIEYAGDAVHGPSSETRTVIVSRRTPVLTSAVSAPTIATGDQLTISWQLLGPAAGTVKAGYPSSIDACVSTALRGLCAVSFPVSQAGANVPIAVTFAGDALWNPVSNSLQVAVIGCYPVTLSVTPAGAGTLSASRPPDCNRGTGYLAGTRLTVTAEPSAEASPEFDWRFDRMQPDAASVRLTQTGAQLDIVVGPRSSGDVSAGPTNWVRAEFAKIYRCVSVELITESYGGASGSLDAAAPNCPIDAAGGPVGTQRWTTTVSETNGITTTTRRGQVLAGSILPLGTSLGSAESETYGFSHQRTGALTLRELPSIHADNAITVARVRFGPRCHALELAANGPGELVLVSAINCNNPLTEMRGWTAGSSVELLGIATAATSATASPNFITAWLGADAATGVAGDRNNVLIAGGGYRFLSQSDQRNTVTILGTNELGAGPQQVSARFATCATLTLKAVTLSLAKGSVSALTPGNCPGFESRAQTYLPGTVVRVGAVELDWVRKAPFLTSEGKEVVVNSAVSSFFGEWSDGGVDAIHDFTIEENTTMSASFWYNDQVSRVVACAPIQLYSAYPERLLVELTTQYDAYPGCPRGDLSEPASPTKNGQYTTTLNPDNPEGFASSLDLKGIDTAENSSALIGWQYRVSNNPGTAIKGYYPSEILNITGARKPISATASLCEKLDVRVALTNDRGEVVTSPVPEDSSLVMVSPAPNCPFDQTAWKVGTTVEVGAFGDPIGYAFTGWSGVATGGAKVTPVLLDGIGPKQVTAAYVVTCFTLTLTHDSADVTRYPEPNCPGYDPAESSYAGSTLVSLYGKVPGGKVWQGWVGDLVQTGKVNPATVLMDADKTAGHRWRSRTAGEAVDAAFDEVGDAIVSVADDAAIIAKKMAGGLMLVMVELVKWLPPMGIVTAINMASAQIADLLAVMGVPKGSVEWLKAGQKVFDFAYSGLSCGAVWAMNGNGNEKDNLFARDPGDDSSNAMVDAAVDVKDGALGVKGAYTTVGFVNAARSGYEATRTFSIANSLGGLGIGGVGLGTVGTMAGIVMGGGFGIDASAEAAWTDSDAYTSCLQSKIPSF